MVLFFCGHIGGISQIISLRCHRYAHEEVVLSVPDTGFLQSNFAQTLVEEKIFNKIIVMNVFFSVKEESVESQEQKILDYFDTFAEQNDIDFNKFSDIYVAQDISGEFPVYLSMRNIPYILIEMQEENTQQFDKLFRYSVQEVCVKGTNPSYTAVLKKYKALFGNEDVCKKRLRAENKTSDHSKSLPKDEWVDFNLLFNNISEEYKKSICKCLDKNISSLQEKDSCLILPNSTGFISNTPQLDYAHVHLIHQLAIDYYNRNDESRIIVKEHIYTQSDFPLSKYIENSIVLDPFISIEFYKFIPNFSVNRILSMVTTAVDKIVECVKENIRLGNSYFKHFRLCHKLFFAFSLHLKLNSGGGGRTNCNHAKGLDTEFIHNFAHFCFNDFPNYEPRMEFRWQTLKGNNFIIMDEVPLKNKKELITGLHSADPLTKIVFLNTKKDFVFFDFERLDLLEYIIPFVIKKSAVSNKCISDTEDETLFFFCKDKAVRDAARTFSMQKSLKHTKLMCHISAVSWDADEFWEVAQSSPFYETLLNRQAHETESYQTLLKQTVKNRLRALKDATVRILSPFFPLGTRRRAWLTKAYEELRGR